MPFPGIRYCLICEGVRPELGGKLSVFGFYGVTPNVDIAIGRFGQPLPLTFVLGFGTMLDEAQYLHSVEVRNPDGSVLVTGPEGPINTVRGRPGIIVFGAMVVPAVAGQRTIRVFVNRQQVFEDRFTLRQARPDEVAGMPGAILQ
jgi:hypothetical protein